MLLVGESPGFLELKAKLHAIARLQRTTLITGPTGAGKDMIARSLHEQSPRASSPFVAVHCAALPDHLVEAELFGHSRGAFTGAVQARAGLVRSAASGTLFLDEIDSLSLPAQAKLLRFLENGEYRAVGMDRTERSDSWIIAATNQNLHTRVEEGRFRADLLYRLEVVKMDVPALSQRRSDVPLLASHFLCACGAGNKRLSEAAVQALVAYDWPGNVRELKHRLESAALLSDGEVIEPRTLGLPHPAEVPVVAPAPDRAGQARPSGADTAASGRNDMLRSELWRLIDDQGLTLAEATTICERLLIEAALRAEGENRTRAATRLGIHVRTIYKKMPER